MKQRTIQPECLLLSVALPLELVWEIVQLPLYTLWEQSHWTYILFSLLHCTAGDLLIALIVFEIMAVLNGTRHWFIHASSLNGMLFTGIGLAYTIYSELHNVNITRAWSYTNYMPLIPWFNVGLTPFLQWLILPTVIVRLMREMGRGGSGEDSVSKWGNGSAS